MTIKTDAVIIGAGPVGLFQVFELGLLDIKAHVVDVLAQVGGQCSELYPDKPIYDIPTIPVCAAQEMIDRLLQQIEPFGATYHLGQEITSLVRLVDGTFYLKTTKGTEFKTRTVIIAAGVGAFQPRRLNLKDIEAQEGNSVHYKVSDPQLFAAKDVVVLGGGDSALDWVLELRNIARHVTLIHRSQQFRAAPASVTRLFDLQNRDEIGFLKTGVSGTGCRRLNDTRCPRP